MSAKLQRLRVTFTRGEEMKYITHLDLMRFWERALRRAELPVAYSEGFSPHAQIALAAPLPVGTTSDCELMDVFMGGAHGAEGAAYSKRAATARRHHDRRRRGGRHGAAVGQADVRFAEY